MANPLRYTFLSPTLLQEASEQFPDASAGLVTFLRDRGLSKAESSITLIEAWGVHPIQAKRLVIESVLSPTLVLAEQQIREQFEALAPAPNPGSGNRP